MYDGACRNVVKQMLKLYKDPEPYTGYILEPYTGYLSVFVPVNHYEKFKEEMLSRVLLLNEEHVWNYKVKIDDSRYEMKLVWCRWTWSAMNRIMEEREIQKSFSFLQKDYLTYLDKPLRNPNVTITQVNLLLDYHRTQKRQRGIEIFNIFDLIAFKMAIDDNRFKYGNCEFHKIIDRTLGELVQSGIYMDGDKFNLNKYMHVVGCYRIEVRQLVNYMVYHFQKTIGSIYWSDFVNLPNKLSNITNVPAYLERCWREEYGFTKQAYMKIEEISSNGKCAEVLYDLLTTSKMELKFVFALDCEWIYTGVECGLLNNIHTTCDITIITKNSFHFIENFINWLKLSFGNECPKISLEISKFETIQPYLFNNFHIDYLEIAEVALNHSLVRMFKNIKWIKSKSYCFSKCRIPDDINERFEFFRRKSAKGQNIFKLLDELQNVDYIHLALEEHTIGTLFAHVAAVMLEKNIENFKFTNDIRLIPDNRRILRAHYPLRFLRSGINTDFVHLIDSGSSLSDFFNKYYTSYLQRSGANTNFDVYELINGLEPWMFDRDEYEFYK